MVSLFELLNPSEVIFVVMNKPCEDIVRKKGCKGIEKLNVCSRLLRSPFLVNCFSEFLYNVILHGEKLGIAWIKHPIIKERINIQH